MNTPIFLPATLIDMEVIESNGVSIYQPRIENCKFVISKGVIVNLQFVGNIMPYEKKTDQGMIHCTMLYNNNETMFRFYNESFMWFYKKLKDAGLLIDISKK